MANVKRQQKTVTQYLIQSAQGIALLFPLLAQATETRVAPDAATVTEHQLPVQQAPDNPTVHKLYGIGTSGSLADVRDPRIAGLSINDLLPTENEPRNNTVRYPVVPVAAMPSTSWSAPSSGPSPLLTYIGAVAAGIAAGNHSLPYTSNQMIKPAGTYDSKTPP